MYMWCKINIISKTDAKVSLFLTVLPLKAFQVAFHFSSLVLLSTQTLYVGQSPTLNYPGFRGLLSKYLGNLNRVHDKKIITSGTLRIRIEDETHFLLDCPSFSSIREMFFSKPEPRIPFLRLQSHKTSLPYYETSELYYFINTQLISTPRAEFSPLQGF